MKTVLAIIRIDKMNDTKNALSEAGISSMTATGNAMGRGKGLWDAKVMDGARKNVPEAIELLSKEPRLRPQRIVTVTVPDAKVKKVVDLIMEANCTGNPGDGKIFVLPELDAISVRNGQRGNAVLD